MINLTEQQFKIFDVIKGHVNDYGYPPTRAEIAKIMGLKVSIQVKAAKGLSENSSTENNIQENISEVFDIDNID